MDMLPYNPVLVLSDLAHFNSYILESLVILRSDFLLRVKIKDKNLICPLVPINLARCTASSRFIENNYLMTEMHRSYWAEIYISFLPKLFLQIQPS